VAGRTGLPPGELGDAVTAERQPLRPGVPLAVGASAFQDGQVRGDVVQEAGAVFGDHLDDDAPQLALHTGVECPVTEAAGPAALTAHPPGMPVTP